MAMNDCKLDERDLIAGVKTGSMTALAGWIRIRHCSDFLRTTTMCDCSDSAATGRCYRGVASPIQRAGR
jgi:hypothetical protein